MANNLFYSLYSHSKDKVQSGYTCTSALDETGTSFDITNKQGVITDSNGDTLSSIDLSGIHAENITQYVSETKIIEPDSCVVLQGLTYGLAYGTYYFTIPTSLNINKNYDYFLNIKFDIVVNDNFKPTVKNFEFNGTGVQSITNVITQYFNEHNINITCTLQEINKVDYIVFTSGTAGLFYYVMNVQIKPILQSNEYPNSPYSIIPSNIKEVIYDLIKKHHPIELNQTYDENTYKVECPLYTWLCKYHQAAIQDYNKWVHAVNYDMDEGFTEDTNEIRDTKFYPQLLNTVYINNSALWNKYDLTNLKIIKDIIGELKNNQDLLTNLYNKFTDLTEEKTKRIPLMKYPNGAVRGILIVPDYPQNEPATIQGSNQTMPFTYNALKVHHISDLITYYKPVDNEDNTEKHYTKNLYGVLTNRTLFSNDDKEICHITPDTDYMGLSLYIDVNEIIGMMQYMQFVNDNNLWTSIGDFYAAIGKPDNVQEKPRNYPTSVLVYNPNNVPIRIKYMMFV